MTDCVVAHLRVLQNDSELRDFELLLNGRDESATWAYRCSSSTAPHDEHFVMRATPATDNGMASSLGFELALALVLLKLKTSTGDVVRIFSQRNPVAVIGDLEFPIARPWPWFDPTLFAQHLTSFDLAPRTDDAPPFDDELDRDESLYVFNQTLGHRSGSDGSQLATLQAALAVPMPQGSCATGIIFDGEFLIGQVGTSPSHAFLAFVLEKVEGHPAAWIPYPTADPDERGLNHRGYVYGGPDTAQRATEGPAFGDLWFRFRQPDRNEPGFIELIMAEDQDQASGSAEPTGHRER